MDATQVARRNELSQQYRGSMATPQTAAFLNLSEKKELLYLLELQRKQNGQTYDTKRLDCNHACYFYKNRGKQEALDLMYRHKCNPYLLYDTRCKADLLNYYAEMLKHRATQNLANTEKKPANTTNHLANKTAGISLAGGKTRRHRTRKSRSRRSRK